MANNKKVKVTLRRSTSKALPAHKACVKGLGLRKTNSSAILIDTPCVRGMINKVNHLISVEEV